MMTSRTEYRLLHRQDNADQRLTPVGREIGLVSAARAREVEEKYAAVAGEIRRLEQIGVPGAPALAALLTARGEPAPKNGARLGELLRRPRVSYEDLAPFDSGRPELAQAIREQVEICMKYDGYIARQNRQVEQLRKMEAHALPPDLDYTALEGLRLEAREKLQQIRPVNLGQASRISGVSPADVAALMIWLERHESAAGGARGQNASAQKI